MLCAWAKVTIGSPGPKLNVPRDGSVVSHFISLPGVTMSNWRAGDGGEVRVAQVALGERGAEVDCSSPRPGSRSGVPRRARPCDPGREQERPAATSGRARTGRGGPLRVRERSQALCRNAVAGCSAGCWAGLRR